MRDFSKYQGVIPAFYACYDDLGAVSATKEMCIRDRLSAGRPGR